MNKKFALPKIKNELYLGILILMLVILLTSTGISGPPWISLIRRTGVLIW